MKRKTTETVPVFANRAPWNELLIRGQRRVKTLSFNWKHRGPILLYTSSNRQDDIFGLTYKLKDRELASLPLGAIVGKANVIDVIPTSKFTDDSYYQHDPNLWETTGQAYVVLVDKVKRFKKPVLFKPPKGAVRISRAPAKLLKRPTV